MNYVQLLHVLASIGVIAGVMLSFFSIEANSQTPPPAQFEFPAHPAFSSPNWSIVDQGDFDGDGNQDIVWRSIPGEVSVWLLDGNGNFKSGNDLSNIQPTDAQSFGVVDPNFKIGGVGDINADGFDDIAWRHDLVDSTAFWYLTANTTTGVSFVSGITNPVLAQSGTDYDILQIPLSIDWKLRDASDINGDNYADLLWRNAITGQIAVWEMDTNLTPQHAYFTPYLSDLSWELIAFDAYGPLSHKLLWQNTVTGAKAGWYIKNYTEYYVGDGISEFLWSGAFDPSQAINILDYTIYS